MSAVPPPFASLRPAEPLADDLRRTWVGIAAAAADPGQSVAAVIDQWEAASRPPREWASWAYLRFAQDTASASARSGRDRSDALVTLLKELDDPVLAALLDRPDQEALRALVGPAVVARWRADRAAFNPVNLAIQLQEQALSAEYVALTAGARIPFEGTEHTLVTIAAPAVDADRARRMAAERARAGWFAEQAGTLDRIFDDLVTRRTAMARTMGMSDYVPLGYLQMHRIDYDESDVDRFRAEVRNRIVPLVSGLMEEQRARLGVERLHLWDETIADLAGPPALLCGMDGLGAAGVTAFDALDPTIAAFYRQLRDGGYVDLGARPGKAGGGFCTWLHDAGSPFVFCSGNGTDGDVRTLVHEVGHAFQCWTSRDIPVAEAIFPTYEAAEIHSMSLEFLAWPTLDTFFGERADDFRRNHLIGALRFLPYGVAVDHFQHLVYRNPEATPADRHQMWAELERTYLPWRDHGGLPHVSAGGYWQRQRHIYARPFYYVDYTLAQTCALQLWAASLDDHASAMARYHALCRPGGRLPFQQLVALGGLTSPFARGCLDRVADRAEAWLSA